MSAKHTPGPWALYGENVHGVVVGATAAKHPASYVSIACAGVFRHRGEGLANARLIAAAPELLDIAKRVEAMLSRHGWRQDGIGAEPELLRDARDVITAATGSGA